MGDADAPPTVEDPVAARRDALVERLDGAVTAALELCAVYLGDRLGYYRALAAGPLTPAGLAARTGTHERYAREWLEQQAVAGVLDVDNPPAPPAARRFGLPPGHAEALADPDSPNYAAPLARIAVGATRPLAAVLEAFRTGGGVPFAAYGADFREGMADGNRASHLRLGPDRLATIPDLDARLRADPPARVADIGCGAGWSCIGIARAYPEVRVDGFDLDAASVALARGNVADAGLGDRVRVEARDIGDPALAGRYDLVMAIFCLHDLPRPVDILRAMRRLAGPEGVVLLADPAAGERFLDPGNDADVERQFYGFSVLHCLPVGMAEQPSAATGAVMRPGVLRGYARDAGFRSVEILPNDNPWTAFYRLHP